MNVKPILSISNGAAHFVGISRTKERGVKRIIQTMHANVGEKSVHIAVIHADAPDEAYNLKQLIESNFNCVELWTSEFSPIMGYTTGRGLLGLAFYYD